MSYFLCPSKNKKEKEKKKENPKIVVYNQIRVKYGDLTIKE